MNFVLNLAQYERCKAHDTAKAQELANSMLTDYNNEMNSCVIRFGGVPYARFLKLLGMLEAMLFSSGFWVRSTRRKVAGSWECSFELQRMSDTELLELESD